MKDGFFLGLTGKHSGLKRFHKRHQFSLGTTGFKLPFIQPGESLFIAKTLGCNYQRKGIKLNTKFECDLLTSCALDCLDSYKS